MAQALRNFPPAVPELSVQLKKLDFVCRCPDLLVDSWVQVVDPPLPYLFAGSPFDLEGFP